MGTHFLSMPTRFSENKLAVLLITIKGVSGTGTKRKKMTMKIENAKP
jgi:hypothetical protein